MHACCLVLVCPLPLPTPLPVTAGTHIVSVGTTGATCAVDTYLNADGGVPMWRTCTSWAGTPTLQLALLVNGDCSITVKPITDESCSDPGAVDGELVVGYKPDTTYGYSYNDLVIRAYYQTPSAIRSLMPSGATKCVSLSALI